jgi:branched-chain amino acid transport system ATP-binding protein
VSEANDTLIEARGVSAGYGKVAVVRELDLHVERGEVVALLGANGAGKSTTLLTLAGGVAPLEGEIRFLGSPTRSPMHARCRNGLGYLPEERSVIMGMSVTDNLRLADVSEETAIGYFPTLEPLMRRRAGLCSGGEQQMLAVARALGRDPKVLMADELSLGLAPLVVATLLQTLRRAARERGVGVLVVEQHVSQALAVADRVYLMERGRVVLTGSADEIGGQLERVEAAYLSGSTLSGRQNNEP